jgi:phosphate transport system substrate-binding protein
VTKTSPNYSVPRRILFVAALLGAASGAWFFTHRSATLRREPARSSIPAPAPERPTVILRLHGSNTIGGELGPALAEAYLRWKSFDDVQRRPGKIGEASLISGRLRTKLQAVEIEAEGSATAFSDLGKRACDIGMASRPIKASEAEELIQKGLGDLRTPAGEHVLGLDGIAVIVHPNNPLQSVDLAQLKRLFAGDATDFASVGGAAKSVSVYARDDNSGTYDTFKHLVLGDQPLASNAKRFMDSSALSDAVASDVQGIGFIGIAYVRGARALAVGEAGSPPLYPSAFTVATEDYALSRRLYLYLPVQAANPTAVDFVNFALSPDGQHVVGATGFVDLTVQAIEARPCDAHCSARYATLTRGARRLSLDFRFTSGRAELDSRGLRDLDRLISFLRSANDAKLMLLGFSDSRGSVVQNLALSRERAKVVDAALTARGVHATWVDALGQDMPVAPNDSDSGREKNRRVEVWLR